MQSVIVSGRFVDADRRPVEGSIMFRPSRIWVDEEEASYPVPAPELSLTHGAFQASLIRTDQHGPEWFYTVICPVGEWSIRITDDGPLLLRDLLPKRFST